MKRFVSTIFFLFLAIIFIGCDSKDVTITELEVIGEQNEFDQNFELSNLKLKVTKSDGSVEYVPLSEEMINSSDLNKFSTEGTHTISVKYLNNSATFTITISGEKGDDGREVELRVFDGYIQWRHEGDSTWNNLISVSELKGTSGADGAAGREVEFQTTAEYVQWRYEGDTAWKNLMALTALKGSDGAAGREVEFQTTADYVQWRYAGDSAWINLIDLTLLKGADGAAATIGISEDGYWVINGEKTIYKVVPEMVEPPLCTVSFDLAGGEMPEGFDSEIEVAKGDSIVLPIPAKDGYLFAGWFTGDTVNDGQFLNFHTVTKNITLYAHWELDYQVLIDYFNLFKEQNCTVSFDGHSTYLYEDGYYESEMYEVYKQFFLNDDLFISVEDGEKEIISDYIVDVLESQQYAILHDKHVYSMIFDNDDYLNFDSFPDYYHGFNRKHLYFARYFQADSFDQYVDVTEFDRREGTNIYDYRQPVEFIMGLYQLDSLDYEALNPSVYLNLETLTLTIESCFDLGDGQFQELNVAITLSAVGSTYFELPIEQIVLLAHKELDNIIEYYNPYCMDSDSYEFFMSLIDEARI
ncbi:MAG: InlB B-repeat-containing protein, partial [Bacilli bacterium]|nr:InlB B-repeat-containing protein [Bacilli bacterium]